MMQKIIHPVLSSMPNPSKLDASLSALERARMDDKALAVKAIAAMFNQALKPLL